MNKKAFTLIEILVTVIIMGIFASIVIPNYQNFVEKQKAKACESNLKVLQEALDIYAIDHDTMPASLSELPSETLDKAFARVLERKGSWQIKLAYFIVDLNRDNLLYAAVAKPFIRQLVRSNSRVLVCPKDTTVLSHGGVSYGINSILAGKTKKQYKNLANATRIFGDCGSTVFSGDSQLKTRHSYHKNILTTETYALAVTKKGESIKIMGSTSTRPPDISIPVPPIELPVTPVTPQTPPGKDELGPGKKVILDKTEKIGLEDILEEDACSCQDQDGNFYRSFNFRPCPGTTWCKDKNGKFYPSPKSCPGGNWCKDKDGNFYQSNEPCPPINWCKDKDGIFYQSDEPCPPVTWCKDKDGNFYQSSEPCPPTAWCKDKDGNYYESSDPCPDSTWCKDKDGKFYESSGICPSFIWCKDKDGNFYQSSSSSCPSLVWCKDDEGDFYQSLGFCPSVTWCKDKDGNFHKLSTSGLCPGANWCKDRDGNFYRSSCFCPGTNIGGKSLEASSPTSVTGAKTGAKTGVAPGVTSEESAGGTPRTQTKVLTGQGLCWCKDKDGNFYPSGDESCPGGTWCKDKDGSYYESRCPCPDTKPSE